MTEAAAAIYAQLVATIEDQPDDPRVLRRLAAGALLAEEVLCELVEESSWAEDDLLRTREQRIEFLRRAMHGLN